MKKLLTILLLTFTVSAAPGPPLNPFFNPTNNNLISPTNLNFFNLGITNPLLVTNLTSFILWAAGNTPGSSTNAQVVTANSLGVSVDGVTDDTATFLNAIGIANAAGKTIDLQGRTSLVTQISITVPIKIQNGIIRQFSAQQTNLSGMISVSSSNVVFERVFVDGANKTLRGIYLSPGAHLFNFSQGGGLNFLQPTNHGAQVNFFMADWDTSFRFHDGWVISNITAVANSIIGDDPGAARAFTIVRSSGNTNNPPVFTIENGSIYNVTTTGVDSNEDSDGIVEHRIEGKRSYGKVENIFFKNVTKRGVKAMNDGIYINNLRFDLSDITDTNNPMLSAVSLYAGEASVSGVNLPAGLFSYGIEIVNNNNVPLSDVNIFNNNIGAGINTLTNPVMIGIKVGGLEGFHNVRIIGNSITNAHMGIQIAGNVTNYAVLGNIISNPIEEGVMDGYRYSGDLAYTNNWNGVYVGNIVTGTPTGGGIRFRRTKDVIIGQNFMPTSYSYAFDNGYGDTVKTGGGIYQNNIYGGTLTNLAAIHIGTNSTTLFGEIPDFQLDTATGTNAIISARFRDGTYNRFLAVQVNTNGVYFTASQTTGGAGNIFFQNNGTTTVGQFNASGVFIAPFGVKATNLMNWSQTLTNYYALGTTDQTNVVQLPLLSSGAGDTNLFTLGKLTSFGFSTIGGINIGTIDPLNVSLPTGGTLASSIGNFGSVNITTNLTFDVASRITNFPTGLGLTNVAGIVSNNIVAGANITITAGASGQLSIASSGGGGGNVHNPGTIANGNIPQMSANTNLVTSPVNVNSATNITVTGGVLADNGVFTNGITLRGTNIFGTFVVNETDSGGTALNRFALFSRNDGSGVDDSSALTQDTTNIVHVTTSLILDNFTDDPNTLLGITPAGIVGSMVVGTGLSFDGATLAATPPYITISATLADNTTDISTAVNTAMTLVGNPATNAIRIPAGAYKSRPWANPPAGLIIFGDGMNQTRISLIAPAANDVLINITNSSVVLRDFALNGSNANFNVSSSPVAITGIVHEATGPGGVYNVKLEGFKTGLYIKGNGDTTTRINAASYRANYVTNCWAGIMAGMINTSEYTSVQNNLIQRCYQGGIYNYGAGNVAITGNNVHDCGNYTYYHGGTSVSKGNSLVSGNMFNHGQIFIGAPGGGTGMLTFTGNNVQGGSPFVFDTAAGLNQNNFIHGNTLGISYFFLNSSGVLSNTFIHNNYIQSTTPNRYFYTGPNQVHFWNNIASTTGELVFEGDKQPITKFPFHANYTVTKWDQVLMCYGTNQIISLPDPTITTVQSNAVAVVSAGKWYEIIAQTATTTVIYTNGLGAQTLTGPAKVRVYSDGANWW